VWIAVEDLWKRWMTGRELFGRPGFSRTAQIGGRELHRHKTQISMMAKGLSTISTFHQASTTTTMFSYFLLI
jgi:hypothetical protein